MALRQRATVIQQKTRRPVPFEYMLNALAHPRRVQLSLSQMRIYVGANNVSDLSDNFIIAESWQESGFQPDVYYNPSLLASPRGLLQVSPGALAQIIIDYPGLGYDQYTVKDLTTPSVNILVGTAYLQDKLDIFLW